MIDLNELERLEREATAGPWRDDNGLRVYAPDPDPAMMSDDHESLLFSTKHTAAKSADSPLCAALRNAARELIADAKRYRWLLNEIDRTDFPPLGRVVWKLRNDRESHLWCDFAMSQEVSAAIDAAIAKEKQ